MRQSQFWTPIKDQFCAPIDILIVALGDEIDLERQGPTRTRQRQFQVRDVRHPRMADVAFIVVPALAAPELAVAIRAE